MKMMHPDEIAIDKSIVSRLIEEQFPGWAHLPIMEVTSSGTDNALFRLGQDMVIRMPRIPAAAEQVKKEQRWLPRLAPLLPYAIPAPLVVGEPCDHYQLNWSIYNWLEGETPSLKVINENPLIASQITEFIKELHKLEIGDGPAPGIHNSQRGEPLLNRDENVQKAIHALSSDIDTKAIRYLWNMALKVSPSPTNVWIHGDLQPGNLLVKNGELSAVIDFGCMAVGDRACDLIIAWNSMSSDQRQRFRQEVSVDDETWLRGLGWALSIALIALPYYKDTNPVLAEQSRRTIFEVTSDHLL